MKAMPVAYREEAIADLEIIYLFIAQVSSSDAVASRFVDRIMKRCAKLGFAPNAGRKRDDLLPGLRTVPFERKAVITYIILHEQIEITNVFYGGRDYEALFPPLS